MKTIWVLLGVAFALLGATARAQEFHGYTCRVDCSGHEAGYEWAELYDITDADDCHGDSQSFVEGCLAWVHEQAEDGY